MMMTRNTQRAGRSFHSARTVRLTALLAFAAALTFTAAPASAQTRGLRIGDTAPTAMVQTLDGKPADLAEIIGKRPAFIEFWATWCPLCKQLEPTIKELHAKYGDKLEIVRIVVPQNQTAEKAREYVTRNELPGKFFFDADGAAYKAFAAYHTSYIVVLDRNGKVVHSEDGATQDLESAIRKVIY
ncbi:MAG: TlpA disulfide reductase family protein [Gemmatimonadaceae bacterium]